MQKQVDFMITTHKQLFGLVVVFIVSVASVVTITRQSSYYDFYLLENQGLAPSVSAASIDECANKCVAAGNCSAVSYNRNSQSCVLSFCSALQLRRNNGWNSRILSDSRLVESVDYSAPSLEWILSDSCGFVSTGSVPGVPSMNATPGVTFASSPSRYTGNALRFNGSNDVYAMTTAAFFDGVYLNKGFTVSGWYYYEAAPKNISQFGHAYFEFGETQSKNGIWQYAALFWYWNKGVYWDLAKDFPNLNLLTATAPYVPPLNTWIHVAYVYNPSVKTMNIYLNGSIFYQSALTAATAVERNILYYAFVGARPLEAKSGFSGRAFCVKLHLQSLTGSDVWANGLSCFGRIRFV